MRPVGMGGGREEEEKETAAEDDVANCTKHGRTDLCPSNPQLQPAITAFFISGRQEEEKHICNC